MKTNGKAFLKINFILLILGTMHFSFAQNTFTLPQLTDSAQANFPLIQQYQLIEQTKEYTISNANKAYLPQLSISLIGGVIDGLPSFSPTASESGNLKLLTTAQLNQVIWDGGLTKNKKQIAEINATLATTEVHISMVDIQNKVYELYFGILLMQAQSRQMTILQENLLQHKTLILARVKNGIQFQSEADEIEIELLNLDQKLNELEYTKVGFQKMLSAMVGFEISSADSLVHPPTPNHLYSEINRPELQKFQNQRLLVETQQNLVKSNLYPKLGLMGYGVFLQPETEFGPSTFNHLLVGGISLSWSINGLYQNKNNTHLVELQLKNIHVQEETFLYQNNLLKSQVEQEIMKYNLLLENDQKLIELKQRITKSYQAKYKNGVGTMTQLLIKMNEENSAIQNQLLHEIQLLKSWYTLKNITGN